jgi:ornithine cyclodeaminase/alanine dehydrogenase-like protein (mu-crystallin family)
MFRRGFLAAASALTAASAARVIGANDRLQIGVIGCGGTANGHMRALNGMKESDTVYRRRATLDSADALRPSHWRPEV